jgi:hypothetical protein
MQRLKAGGAAAACSFQLQAALLDGRLAPGTWHLAPDPSPSALTNSIMAGISRKHDFEFDMLATDGADKS